MADVKISELPAASTPLAGTEQIPLVQDATTKQITVSNLLTSANLGTPSAINLANATNVPMDEASGVLAVANGGSGTATPALVAGTNVTISGSWPNQTINSTYSGAVTSVTGTAPVVSSGGTTPAISMAAATGSVNGYLTSTDWTTFNNKLTSGGPLGTPSSGTATNLTGLPLSTGVTGLLPVANGGTGTATPNLVAGSNVTISGTWPNQTIAAAGAAQVYPDAGIANSTGSAWGTSYSTTGSGTVVALATSPTFVTPALGVPASGDFSSGTFTWPTFNQNTTGTAANITATSNSSLTTLSSLSLPGSQVSGNISGNAGNVSGIVAVANGGTGTATPSLVAGTNVTITGTWPNQTIAASGGGGGSGTVTSVDVSGGTTGLTTSGGPVTTSGTITIGGTLATTNGGTGLTSFTANGVIFASSTSALTSGSALTFDGNKLAVTGAGIGGADDRIFTVTNTAANSYGAMTLVGTSRGGYLNFYNGATAQAAIVGQASALSFYVGTDSSGSQSMILNSTGLGIGTSSPSTKLDISGGGTTAKFNTLDTYDGGASLSAWMKVGRRAGTGTNAYINTLHSGSDAVSALTWAFGTSGTGTEVMRLDSAGNLGLGVTPSAWRSGDVALDIGSIASLVSAQSSNTRLYNNTFVASGGTNTYKTSSFASYYDQGSGVHRWFTAPSGTAGNAISFTQAMTLDASGNLGVGTTSPSSRFDVRTSSTTSATVATFSRSDAAVSATIYYDGSDGCMSYGTTTNHPIAFRTNNTERARIDSSGNLLVGKTAISNVDKGATIAPSGEMQVTLTNAGGGNQCIFLNREDADGTAILFRRGNGTVGSISVSTTATAYNTSSDYRLKNTIAPMTGALAKVALLKPCTYKWNADGSDGEGFIAHELAEVVPQCVTGEKDAVDENGNPKYQGIDTSFLVATLTAALQEQQSIIQQLQADVATLKGN